MNKVQEPQAVAERQKDISAARREQLTQHIKSLPSDQLQEVVKTFERNGAPEAEIALVRELTSAPRSPIHLIKPAKVKTAKA